MSHAHKKTTFLTGKRHISSGIAGFADPKFYIVLLLYAASFLAFCHDPFFLMYDRVVYQQGMVVLFFSVVMFNTLNWELLLFGKPIGANLLLQLLAVIPGAMCSARILGNPTHTQSTSLLGEAQKLLFGDLLSEKVLSFPEWTMEILHNWKIALLFFGVLLMLSFLKDKRYKVAAIFTAFLIPFLLAVSETLRQSGSIVYLVTGMLLLGFGMALQFSRYDRVYYFEMVDAALRQQPQLDALTVRTIVRIMAQLECNEKLSESAVRQIVAGEYARLRQPGNEYSDIEFNQIAAGVARKMVTELNLVTVHNSGEGSFMYPVERLFVNNGILSSLAQWPRILVIVLFALLWVVCPLDFIPDAMPGIGTLDDVIVGATAVLSVASGCSPKKRYEV